MVIDHNKAVSLEWIVRDVHQCLDGGMGGYITAGHFQYHPFDAALLALAPIWKMGDENVIGEFLFKWDCVFNRPEYQDEPADVDAYIDELRTIVYPIMGR